jgi:hypothetical protein
VNIFSSRQTALRVLDIIELPSDSRSDEITIKIDEAFSHFGFQIPKNEFNQIRSLISKCPSKKNVRYDSKSHQLLEMENQNGLWIDMSPYQLSGQFWIR